MAVSTIKRTFEEKSTSLGVGNLNGAFTNTGSDASITFTRIGKLVIMHGWFKTGQNLTGDINTYIFNVPQGFAPRNPFEFIGANETTTALINFYVDGSAQVFTRTQLATNKKYNFSHCYLGF